MVCPLFPRAPHPTPSHRLCASQKVKNAMSECNKKNSNVLRQLIVMTTQELTPMNRTKLETLITIQVHQRDVFEELNRIKCQSPFEFDWLKQTRFYWNSDKELVNIQVRARQRV